MFEIKSQMPESLNTVSQTAKSTIDINCSLGEFSCTYEIVKERSLSLIKDKYLTNLSIDEKVYDEICKEVWSSEKLGSLVLLAELTVQNGKLNYNPLPRAVQVFGNEKVCADSSAIGANMNDNNSSAAINTYSSESAEYIEYLKQNENLTADFLATPYPEEPITFTANGVHNNQESNFKRSFQFVAIRADSSTNQEEGQKYLVFRFGESESV
jgi:hypothetical protein